VHSLRRFLAEKILELILAGVVLQLILAGVVLELNRPASIYLLAASVLVLLLVFLGVKELLARRKRQVGLIDVEQTPRKGVIFTIGPRSVEPDSVVRLVIEKLKPDFVGFLGTPKTEEGRVVETLCEGLKLTAAKCKSERWEPTAIREGKKKTEIVIDWMLEQGLSEKDIVLDLTGGTATMSVAAFMAAEERRVDSQYITSEADARKQVIHGSQQTVLITRYTKPPASHVRD
jgi:hypothetical protein